MINLRTRKSKMKYVNKIKKISYNFEKKLFRILKKYFLNLYSKIANNYEKIDEIIERSKPELSNIFKRFYKRIILYFAGFFLDELKLNLQKSFKNLYERKDDLFDELLEDVIETFNKRSILLIDGISLTTNKRIQKIIEEGLRNGEGRTEIAEKILELGEIDSKVRAIRIANTETHSAMSQTFHELALEEDILEEHEWVTAGDERVRYSHEEADGQRVPVDEPFFVDGEYLYFPGDTNGSPGNIINCRCVEIFHTKKSEE